MKIQINDLPVRVAVVFVCISTVFFFQFLGAAISFPRMGEKNKNDNSTADQSSFATFFNAFQLAATPLQKKNDPKIEFAKFQRINAVKRLTP
jgi:hypothetical protein